MMDGAARTSVWSPHRVVVDADARHPIGGSGRTNPRIPLKDWLSEVSVSLQSCTDHKGWPAPHRPRRRCGVTHGARRRAPTDQARRCRHSPTRSRSAACLFTWSASQGRPSPSVSSSAGGQPVAGRRPALSRPCPAQVARPSGRRIGGRRVRRSMATGRRRADSNPPGRNGAGGTSAADSALPVTSTGACGHRKAGPEAPRGQPWRPARRGRLARVARPPSCADPLRSGSGGGSVS